MVECPARITLSNLREVEERHRSKYIFFHNHNMIDKYRGTIKNRPNNVFTRVNQKEAHVVQKLTLFRVGNGS